MALIKAVTYCVRQVSQPLSTGVPSDSEVQLFMMTEKRASH